MTSLRKISSRLDQLLLLLGLVGLVIYFVLLPGIHPDATSEYPLTEEEIIDRATSVAFNQGYDIQGFEWRVARVRSERILDSLQALFPSRKLFDLLEDPSYQDLPAYGWEINGIRATEDEERQFISMHLSQDGEFWDFSTRTTEEAAPVREALLAAYHRPGGKGAPDSVATEELVGRFWAIRLPGRRPPPPADDSLRVSGFNEEDARAIARYYVDKSLLAKFDLSVDSVSRPETADPRLVRVLYSGTETASGLRVESEISINTRGVLQSMQTAFAPETADASSEDDGFSLSFGTGGISAALSLLAYAFLAIFIFVLFIRRMNARLIDVKSAMQDAIWGGLFMLLLVGNSAGWQTIQDAIRPSFGWLAALGMMVASAFFFAFATFITTSATDSVARTVWSQKLETLTLARNARFLNKTMGVALVRGAGLAGIFLGFTTLYLYLPGVTFLSDGEFISGFKTLSSFTAAFSLSGVVVLLTSMMLLLGIGAVLYTKRANPSLLIIVITLTTSALQFGPQSIDSTLFQWMFSGMLGLIFVVAFLKFDYFTSFLGLLIYYVLWQMSPQWLISGSGTDFDLWLTFLLIPGIFVFGLVGLITNREADDMSRFVPTYVREHAQQERIRGELEIARQVQSSLLPRRMPSVQGADIAAMCLPAQEVGGDYFDFIRLGNDRLGVVIGDVSGKGIQAGFFMTLTKGFLHAICCDHDSPAEILRRVNKLFCENVPRGTFISLIYGILDTQQETFTFARAGHDPMLYLTATSDTSKFHKPRGMAIGLTPSNLFDQTIEDHVVRLAPSDLLVFYTDGITEAVNPHSEQFGADRLARQVTRAGMKKSARQVLQEVSEHVQAFVQTAGRADDMTMVVLRIAPVREPSLQHSSSEKPALADT